MPIEDFLPPPPWEGLPIPRSLLRGSKHRHVSTITRAEIRRGVRLETEWGVEKYGEKQWAREVWGKIINNNVSLFHGTSEYILDDILREGLKPGYIGWGYEPEEIEGLPEEERPEPAVWLAYTPYLAFFFGDLVVQVTIPVSWIIEANDGVLVEKTIPPTMIDRYLFIENWR